jgi:3-oxo-5alpha-steroid 4-dehydrogenase
MGGGTPFQQATGHADSPEQMFKFLVAVSPDPDLAKFRTYCYGSVEHFGWIESLGSNSSARTTPTRRSVSPGPKD